MATKIIYNCVILGATSTLSLIGLFDGKTNSELFWFAGGYCLATCIWNLSHLLAKKNVDEKIYVRV